MYTIGIVPAAGKASRWSVPVLKELLPCNHEESFLLRTIRVLVKGGANAIVVVVSPEKYAEISHHLSHTHFDIPIVYIFQRFKADMWGAIREAIELKADNYLFAMPDTYVNVDAFLGNDVTKSFGMGLFQTYDTQRFGVYKDGMVINKKVLPMNGDEGYKAWGVLSWDLKVRNLWRLNDFPDYTMAINAALSKFGSHRWLLDYYFDMASFKDYEAFIQYGTSNHVFHTLETNGGGVL